MTTRTPSSATKRNYLVAALVLFALGGTGGALNVMDAGSLAGSIAQVLGYCGAGYFTCQYLSA